MNRALWWSLAAFGVATAVQPTACVGRDLRYAAVASLVDARRSFMGDPGPSIVAAERLAATPPRRVYAQNLSVGSSFIYPPIAALPYRPLASLPPQRARELLSVASRGLFLVSVLITAALARPRRRSDAVSSLEALGLALVASIAYFPLTHAVQLNQATLLVTALLGLAMLTLDRGRHAAAGVALGFALAIKPQLALILPLLLLHARRMVVSSALTSACLALVSIAHGGIDNHLDYATRVLPTLSRGYAYFANASFNGFFQRLFVDTDIGMFQLPPPSTTVRALTIAAAVAAYSGAAWMVWRTRARRDHAVWVFGLAFLVTTMISPIAWQHHYAPALFVFALLCREMKQLRGLAWPTAAAFALMASYFEVRTLRSAAAQVVASYVLVGAMVLAVTVACVLRQGLRRSTEKTPISVSSS